jgi:hypothetical protein
VRQDDLEPGVWEAVLVAPPNEAVTIELAAALAPLRVTAARDDVVLVNTSARSLTASLEARMLGVAKRVPITGRGTGKQTLPLRMPDWAVQLMVDVRLDSAVWPHITDFAVSLWDSTGALVAEMPLDHRAGRHYVGVDSLTTRALALELLPAFALPDDSTRWSATVTVAFLAAQPSGLIETRLDIPPATPVPVVWRMPAGTGPEGFDPFVEVTARPADGPTTVCRVIVPPGADATGGR